MQASDDLLESDEERIVGEPVAVVDFLHERLDEIFAGTRKGTYRLLRDGERPMRQLRGDSNVFVWRQLTTSKAYGEAEPALQRAAADSLLQWLGGSENFSLRVEDRWQFPDGEIYDGPWAVHSIDGRDFALLQWKEMESRERERSLAIMTCQGVKGADPVEVRKRTGSLWWLTMMDHFIRSWKPLLRHHVQVAFAPEWHPYKKMHFDMLQTYFAPIPAETVIGTEDFTDYLTIRHALNLSAKRVRRVLGIDHTMTTRI